MEVLQGHKGVLIDRVTVVEVADDQGINRLEFGKQPGEQAQAVHVAQGLRGVRLNQDAPEMLPELRRTERGCAGALDLRLHQLFGFTAQREPVPGHHLKQAPEQEGIIGKVGGAAGKDTPPDNRKIGVRQARSPVLIKRVKAGTRGGGFINELGRQLVNDPRLPEIDAHPIRRGQPFRRLHSNATGRGLRLGVITQLVIISSIMVVKEATGIREKAKSPLGRGAIPLRPKPFRRRPRPVFFQLLNAGEPTANVKVAQTARRLFEVGLQMENRVAVLRMALAGQFHQIAHQVLAVPRHHVWDDRAPETCIEVRVSGQVSQVQQGNVEFQIVAIEAATLRQGVRAVSHAHSQVPEHAQKGGNGVAVRGWSASILGQEKQVNVRMGKQFPPAITTQRQQKK